MYLQKGYDPKHMVHLPFLGTLFSLGRASGLETWLAACCNRIEVVLVGFIGVCGPIWYIDISSFTCLSTLSFDI